MHRSRKPTSKKEPTSEGRKIGYARVSTDDQDLRMQIAALEADGCERDWIYFDKRSGRDLKHVGLQEALYMAREGDVLVAWSLDRIGRNLRDLIDVSEHLAERGIHLRTLKDGIDTTTPIGVLYFHIVGAFAQFERSRISERTSAGAQAAKKRGVRFGRRPSLTPKQIERAAASLRINLASGGKRGKSVAQIAKQLGVSAVTLRDNVLAHTGGEKLWRTGVWAGKRRKRKSVHRWVEVQED